MTSLEAAELVSARTLTPLAVSFRTPSIVGSGKTKYGDSINTSRSTSLIRWLSAWWMTPISAMVSTLSGSSTRTWPDAQMKLSRIWTSRARSSSIFW